MRINDNLIISDSLWRLIEDRSKDSQCLDALYRGIMKLLSFQRTRMLATTFPGNYFTYREKTGMISYMPNGREQRIVDGIWLREGRQSMKPSRWIRAMLAPGVAARLKDHVLAEFNDIILHEEAKTMLSFQLVSPEEGYNSSNFMPGIDSCMWDDPVAPFYNAMGAKVLVCKSLNHRRWVGRAVVWLNVQAVGLGTEVTYMDRIYPNSGEVTLAFKAYAVEQGWWRKNRQDKEGGGFITPQGDVVQSRPGLSVKSQNDLSMIAYYPFLDTFSFGIGNEIFTDGTRKGKQFGYRETSGRRAIDHTGEVLDVGGNWIPEDEAINVGGNWYPDDSPLIVKCDCCDEYFRTCDTFSVRLSNGDLVSFAASHLRRNR